MNFLQLSEEARGSSGRSSRTSVRALNSHVKKLSRGHAAGLAEPRSEDTAYGNSGRGREPAGGAPRERPPHPGRRSDRRAGAPHPVIPGHSRYGTDRCCGHSRRARVGHARRCCRPLPRTSGTRSTDTRCSYRLMPPRKSKSIHESPRWRWRICLKTPPDIRRPIGRSRFVPPRMRTIARNGERPGTRP